MSRIVGWLSAVVVFAVVVVMIVVAGIAYNRENVIVAEAPEVRGVESPLTPAGGVGAAEGATSPELAAEVRRVMDSMSSNPALGDLHGVVSAAATGESLWGKDEAVAALPASSMKILTGAAALLELDHGARVETKVLRYPGEDSVVLVGAGDPTLSRSGDGFYDGAASIDDLARQVREATGTAEGAAVDTVYVDASLFGETFHSTWDRSGIGAGYIAPVEPVMVDGARLSLDREDAPRTDSPAAGAGRALADAVGAGTVEVLSDGTGSRFTGQPEVVATVRSAPLIERVRQMMTESDNVLAESLAREVAMARGGQPTFRGAAAAVRDTLAEHGLQLTGEGDRAAVLADSSGLSVDNRLSPAHLTTVLGAAARPLETLPEQDPLRPTVEALRPLLDTLPVAGVSGTLTGRYSGSEGAGWVRAKTGTLDGSSALAGYLVTEGGNVLTFALLSIDAPLLPARAAADEMATALRGIG